MDTITNNPTYQLTCELIRRQSVTPHDEACQSLIIERIQPLGFECHTIESGPAGETVTNLWAIRKGNAPTPKTFVFAGHTDVVPTGPVEHWSSDPFEPSLRDGVLYGRGSADMKASIAAFVTSIEDFLAEHPNPAHNIALLITSDEEGPAVDGTIKVVNWLQEKGHQLHWCLVGEPSSLEVFGDTIKNGRRGSLTGHLTVKGKQGHIAYPQRAKNPIHLVAPALKDLADKAWDQGTDFFQPTSWQASNINAGTGAQNVIPGLLKLDFNFRFCSASTPDGLQKQVTDILDHHQLDYDIKWVLGGNTFITEPGQLSAAIIKSVEDHAQITPKLSTTGGTSDGRFIAKICEQVMEFGPVGKTIHQIDECLDADSIPLTSKIYQAVLKQLVLS